MNLRIFTADREVHGLLARHLTLALIAERRQIKSAEQVLSFAEQDRREGNVQRVDQARFEILPNGGDTAADADVAIAGSLARAIECVVNAAGHEVKHRAAVHLER